MLTQQEEVHEVVLKVGRKLDRVQIIRPLDENVFERANFKEFTEDDFADFDEDEILRSLEPETVTREQAEAEVKEAYDRGFKDGSDVTKAMLEKEVAHREEAIARIEDIMEALQEQYAIADATFEDVAVRLGIMIAEHILQRELRNDTLGVIRQANKALRELHGVEEIKIRVHQNDVDTMKRAEVHLRRTHEQLRTVAIIADNSVEPGGCFLETPIGKLDARIKTQMAQVSDCILRALEAADLETEDGGEYQ